MSCFSSVTSIAPLWLIFSFAACALFGCVSPPSHLVGSRTQTEDSQSAIVAAEALLLSEEAFYKALSDRDPQKMVDAALSRDQVQKSSLTKPKTRTAIAKTTTQMLELALVYAKDDTQLTKRIEEQIKRHERILIVGSFKSFGNPKKKASQDGYVRTLDLEADSSVSVDLTSTAANSSVGTIVYVEHKPNERIVLRIENRDGKVLCTERNSRGYLICRYKPLPAEQLKVIVTNHEPNSTSVLLIKNH